MSWEVIHGDCLEVMRGMPDNSVDAVVTDPPYFKVKDSSWDRQWSKPHEFVAWMGLLCEQWQRVLKPNGSLYVFASPKMSWHVEGAVRERFNVLMNIRWQKPPFSTKAEMFRKSDLRNYFPASETIIFAEHFGSDNIAKGEAGYAAKCDELRGFVFEPLRAYLDGERERAGFAPREVNEATRTQMAGHWFTRVQWALPTAKHYATMRELFNRSGGDYLRREYEDLRRPFSVTAEDQYTDVWTFPTVQAYKGKHECEKPLLLMEHMIKASTRPGAVVLDCFSGSCPTGHACVNLGRSFIGIEMQEEWVNAGRRRLHAASIGARALQTSSEDAKNDTKQLNLFAS